MKVVTWNINSVRAREARLLAWLEAHKPDVLCLQELKVPTDKFPIDAIRELGYDAAVYGQRTYNGVAILSREKLSNVTCGLDDEDRENQMRLIAATIRGIRIICAYFPNGGSLDSDKYPYKLNWMERLHTRLQTELKENEHVILTGDFNVAPFDDDIERVDEYGGSVLANDEVRERLRGYLALGFVDTFRPFFELGGTYTWWDYRARGFERNNGMRIDHLLATPELAKNVIGAGVDRGEREGKGASDHAPVSVEFDDLRLPLPIYVDFAPEIVPEAEPAQGKQLSLLDA